MTKKVLIIAVLMACVLSIFTMNNTVGATTDSGDTSEAKIGNTAYSLKYALENAQEGDTIVLQKNVSYSGSTATDYARAACKHSITLDLNGHDITSTNTAANTIGVLEGTKLTIIGNGNVKYEGNAQSGALCILKGEVILKGGTYSLGNSVTGNAATVQVGYKDQTYNSSDIAKLTIENGAEIDSKGVAIFGTGAELVVNGGTINSSSFAISGNGSGTKNSTITINGGTITSSSTAIYHPQSGKLTINNGTITGNDGFGVVVRNGTVDVKGGTITGKGTGEGSFGDAKESGTEVNLPKGSAILVDNKSAGYGSGNENGKVNISGGTLNSQDENHNAVVSYNGKQEGDGENVDDFNITGGAYSAKFNQAFIKNGAAEVSIETGGDKTYYVGNTAKTAVENAASGSVVTVETGNLTVTSLPSGVIVSGDSTGAITVTNPSSSGSTASALKSNLQALIAKAEGEGNKTEGLTNAISTAKSVLANPGATYGDLQQALANLQSAYDNFKNGTENNNQEIVSGNESNTTGDKGKLDEEPKMGESLTVFGIIAVSLVLAAIVSSRKKLEDKF